ncbi:ABC transporter permease [Corynebacterium uropygiale]|uniref:ABC transporter permease n=1 Tax=Corynebacterium uropygiale TaxID=1775911 RepID=UPI001F158AAA
MGSHVGIIILPILLSVLVAVPLGWVASRSARWGGLIAQLCQLVYVVPILAMMVLFPALVGLPLRSPWTLSAVLTVYGVALLVRTAMEAFHSVPSEQVEVARACGYSRWQRVWGVHVPLAAPVVVSGVRIVAMSTIAMASMGAVVGIPSLGSLLTDGFQRGLLGEVMVGIVSIMLLALLVDGLIMVGSRLLFPWARGRHGGAQ